MKMRYFELAKRLTQFADHRQHKIGVVLIKKNRILSFGYNLLKTHRYANTKYKYIHAEFRAIWGVDPLDLNGATIYIFRQHRDGSPAMAKPCPSCLELIKSVGIKRICYSADNDYVMEPVT